MSPAQRYKQKAYTRIAVWIPKATAAEFKDKCAQTGTPIAQVIKNAITQFLEDEQ